MSGFNHPTERKNLGFDPIKNDSLIVDFFEMYKLLKTPRCRSMLIDLSKELLTREERIVFYEKVMVFLVTNLAVKND